MRVSVSANEAAHARIATAPTDNQRVRFGSGSRPINSSLLFTLLPPSLKSSVAFGSDCCGSRVMQGDAGAATPPASPPLPATSPKHSFPRSFPPPPAPAAAPPSIVDAALTVAKRCDKSDQRQRKSAAGGPQAHSVGGTETDRHEHAGISRSRRTGSQTNSTIADGADAAKGRHRLQKRHKTE
eukprot:GHVU01090608.1.p2 GENE.GHVU01090608.1~~GHVU01090608.1.p2  ORF type:complete len:183 (-),score=16.49 GHVU01090608.1:685-1233(-)